MPRHSVLLVETGNTYITLLKELRIKDGQFCKIVIHINCVLNSAEDMSVLSDA